MYDDAIFEALANDRRRTLLVRLLEEDAQTAQTLSDVSREMTEGNDALIDDYLSSSREIDGADKVAVRDHHVHLPKLADCGLIEWDPESNVVTKGPRYDEIRPLLELVSDRRPRRSGTSTVAADRE